MALLTPRGKMVLGGVLAAIGIGWITYRSSPKRRMKVNPDELATGIDVELEHTPFRSIAKKIALDHLAEDPRYYTKLTRAGL